MTAQATQAEDAPGPAPDGAAEPAQEEVRLALALNGGVSLAVWMGGCAVELDRARRADGAERTGWRVYDVLCRCFGRRLVIDILTGSSAGGINGALLAAAMVKGRKLDLDFLRERWLDLGDASRLLHDRAHERPTSLMRGDRFHRDLLSTFEEVLGSRQTAPGVDDACEPKRQAPPSVPNLDVTMTDAIGVERRFRDAWGDDFVAREHRPRFRFREPADYTAEALAAAARTSASFPLAFEPWPVTGDAQLLAGLKRPTYGIDGGLLDNAPIRSALDMIPARPASSRVIRYLCYINGDPAQPATETVEGHAAPSLLEVGGYTFNLPREAPFVDHLRAIQHAVERPSIAGDVQGQLLCLDIETLHGVARALFGAYRKRRTIESLQELLDEPGDPVVVREVLGETGGKLPWIPASFDPTDGEGRWQWGTHTAQRILHLLLDLLRSALEERPGDEGREWEETRRRLLEWRMRLDRELAALDALTESVSGDGGRARQDRPIDRLAEAAAVTAAQAPRAEQAVWAGARVIREALEAHPERFGDVRPESLFPRRYRWGPRERGLGGFFKRVLSIEVVRRAFATASDVESAAPLRFVQLTPAAPTPLFTRTPLTRPLPTSAEAKLTGVGIGHFAGFYRRSWRANDFMWGRLDAAARIVDLLLSSPSGDVGVGATASPDQVVTERSEFLANALFRLCLPEDAWLLEDLLEDAERADADGTDAGRRSERQGKGENDASGGAAGASLTSRIREQIRSELAAAGTGRESRLATMPFTRAAFQSVAQLEIARDELGRIGSESRKDGELGSAAPPLDFGRLKEAPEENDPEEVRRGVEAVRDIYRSDESLPRRLTGDGEAVSDLGLRTVTHTAFVALAAVRAAQMPLAGFFGLTRMPLLAIAGVVARSWLNRAAVVLGFWAAAVYLTSRFVTAAGGEPAFADAWSLATLAAAVAALGVAGVASVPLLRAKHGVDVWRNSAFGALLLASGGAAAALLAWTAGDLDGIEPLLFPPGAESPDWKVLLASLVLFGVLPLSHAAPLGWLGRGLAWVSRTFRLPLALLPIAGFLLLGGFALPNLLGALDEETWKAIAAWLALAGAPLAAGLAAVALWRPRRAPLPQEER